jgi:hypothetical protein
MNGLWVNTTDIYTVGQEFTVGNNYTLLKWDPTSLPAIPDISVTSANPSTDGNIILDWDDITGATHYLIYKSPTPITSTYNLTPIANQSASTYSDSGVTDGTYYYAVRAGNATGASSPSNMKAVVVALSFVPSAPVLAAFTPNPSITGNLTLDWNDVMGASSYKVYRNNITITTVGALTPIATPTVSTYADLGLTNGSYYYAVVATNASGDSLPSNCKWVIVAIPPTVTTTTTTTTGTGTATNSSTSSSSTSAATTSTSESSVPGYPIVWLGITGLLGMICIIFRKKHPQ